MRNPFTFFCALFLIIPYGRGYSQIMNIESHRLITDTTGWAGTALMSFDYSKTSRELWRAGSNLHIQFKTTKSLYLCLGEYNLTKGSGTDFQNAGVLHFRYNYKFLDNLTGEMFTQSQYNKMLKVKHRWLIGGGPRSKLVGGDDFRLYGAILYMFEIEELLESEVINRDHRLSSYLSLTVRIQNNLRLINTTYFQPKIANFKDHRVMSQTNLNLRISKHFTFVVSYVFGFDKFPATGIPQETHSFRNALQFRF